MAFGFDIVDHRQDPGLEQHWIQLRALCVRRKIVSDGKTLTAYRRRVENKKPFARLDELGVLKAIYPKLAFNSWHAEKFIAARAAPDLVPSIYFALMAYRWNLKDVVEFCVRLKFSKAEAATLRDIVALREETKSLASAHARPSEISQTLSGYTPDAIAAYAIAADDPRVSEHVRLYRTQWQGITPELTGEDLKHLGIPPGPRYREILQRLRNARLDGAVSNREQEQALAQTLWKG